MVLKVGESVRPHTGAGRGCDGVEGGAGARPIRLTWGEVNSSSEL